MIIKRFPTLSWLRTLTEGKSLTKEIIAPNGQKLQNAKWPNVVLNVQSKEEYRPNIKGTLSLFTNIKGKTLAGVNDRLVTVQDDAFFLSNQTERYTLSIDSHQKVETFNIHFGEDLLNNVYTSLSTPLHKILVNEYTSSTIEFSSQLYQMDDQIKYLLSYLYTHQEEFKDPLILEEHLIKILYQLLSNQADLFQKINQLPQVKKSTQIEVYKRLAWVVDYIYSNLGKVIELDDLANVACLSKFHFLRLFKHFFKQTPHQFINNLRVIKAQHLLIKTEIPIIEIAFCLGFEYLSSFTRMFTKSVGVSPQTYRIRK